MFNYFVQLAAFDELHAEIASTIRLAYLVDGHDARMIEAGRGFGFKAKAFEVRWCGPMPKPYDF
jgi:hypothetical protein